MRARFIGVSAALALAGLTAFAPVAGAQDPLPTPTPTPPPGTVTPTPTPTVTPTPEEQAEAEQDAKDRKTKSVRRIYRDFERDGRIEACDHTRKALRKARGSIADSYEQDYPDFKDALKAAIERNTRAHCEQVVEEEATPTPTPTATPAPTTPAPATPAPATPDPTSTPESGSLPDLGGSFDGGDDDGDSGGGSKGDDGGGLEPLPGEDAIPEGTPAPTPAPTQAPPLPPRMVVTRASADPNLFLPGTMLAVALIGLALAALSALAARRSARLAGVGHAWREAAWRASGTWAEFRDWLRSR